MLKRLIFLLLNVLAVSGAMAQQQIRIQCTNQYEAPVGKITVAIAGQTTAYTVDNLGFATINVTPGDSMTITAVNHEPHTVAIASLKETGPIVLQKKFSWKDLLNPMFYIVYGGFFLLLFIVFAETGYWYPL
jgi:membrane-associated protein